MAYYEIYRIQLNSKNKVVDKNKLIGIDSHGIPSVISFNCSLDRAYAARINNAKWAERMLEQCKEAVPENKAPKFKWLLHRVEEA
tara:strand:+ start:1751 stop:2005 length:255 start_codon:yes stop_codon:yes gene_type:complete